MKKLEDLGVSPAPWKADVYDGDCVYYGDGYFLAKFVPSVADARLIAAAPELYECLREALETVSYYAPVDRAKWLKVLEKASGEEVAE